MIAQLLRKLDDLIALHKRNDDMWGDFFETSRDKILKDPAFGCDYLLTGWRGIGGYDDEKIFDNEQDEKMRKIIHPQIYNMALEIRDDKNKQA